MQLFLLIFHHDFAGAGLKIYDKLSLKILVDRSASIPWTLLVRLKR